MKEEKTKIRDIIIHSIGVVVATVLFFIADKLSTPVKGKGFEEETAEIISILKFSH